MCGYNFNFIPTLGNFGTPTLQPLISTASIHPLSSNRQTSEGRFFPNRARLSGVTRKVSSNSIHTLLLAYENKIGEPKLSDY